MATNSRQKGKRGEREAAAYLRELGFEDARRTQQYCGTEGNSDVVCPDSLPGLHIEVKYGYPLSSFDICTSLFAKAVERAVADSEEDWCILWKPHRYKIWRLSFYAAMPDALVTVAGDQQIVGALNWLNGVRD